MQEAATNPALRALKDDGGGCASVSTTHPVAIRHVVGAATIRTPSAPLLVAIPAQARENRATLTLLTGRSAGATFAVQRARPTIIGRAEDADVVLDDSAISRHHARIVRTENGSYLIEDLASTNGTFVNGQTVSRVMLSTGFRVQVGPACVFRFAVVDEAEDSLQRSLYEGATTDSLTGAFNRRHLFDRLDSEVARAQQRGEGLAVLMLDLDRFKLVNDLYGHEAGDRVLRAVAACIRGAMRTSDFLARYGGEEFAVLARTRDPAEAVHLAVRVRRAVESAQIKGAPDGVATTVSIGVATLGECAGGGDARGLVALADRRLYGAKAAGRNKVCAEGYPFGI